MKISIIISSALLLALSSQASDLNEYNTQEKSIYKAAEIEGNRASQIKSIYLNTKEKCNIAYDKLTLTSAQESNIDIYIKGFFEGCTHPHS